MRDARQAAPPATGLAVLACMEASLPAERLYRDRGGAYVVRNVGGEASIDEVRSLVMCHERLGIEKIIVLGHTGCRFLSPARRQEGVPAHRSRGLQSLASGGADPGRLADHLVAQVARLRDHPVLQPLRIDVAVYDDAAGNVVPMA